MCTCLCSKHKHIMCINIKCYMYYYSYINWNFFNQLAQKLFSTAMFRYYGTTSYMYAHLSTTLVPWFTINIRIWARYMQWCTVVHMVGLPHYQNYYHALSSIVAQGQWIIVPPTALSSESSFLSTLFILILVRRRMLFWWLIYRDTKYSTLATLRAGECSRQE